MLEFQSLSVDSSNSGRHIMADEEKKSFPMLPIGHWWTLRKKFKQSIPGVVTDGYLAAVLKMGANSARANVLPFLKTLGIIEKDGKTGERAKQWRDDGRYASVCKEILADVYPQELLDAVSNPSERSEAESWFAHETGAGEAAVARMAVLYLLLLAGDASKAPDEKAERARPERKQAVVAAGPAARGPASAAAAPAIAAARGSSNPPPNSQLTGININLEIHISSDATPDQIDAIFASMAKHIYKTG
jgi:Family of unknown function (DUF5343)